MTRHFSEKVYNTGPNLVNGTFRTFLDIMVTKLLQFTMQGYSWRIWALMTKKIENPPKNNPAG